MASLPSPEITRRTLGRIGRAHSTDGRRMSTVAREASEGGPLLPLLRGRPLQFPDPCDAPRGDRDLRPDACGTRLARHAGVSKRFVYVLKNDQVPPRYYTGVTADVPTRLIEHNAGRSPHTSRYCPWSVDLVVEFADERRALAVERYLKSGSGAAFARRHLRSFYLPGDVNLRCEPVGFLTPVGAPAGPPGPIWPDDTANIAAAIGCVV